MNTNNPLPLDAHGPILWRPSLEYEPLTCPLPECGQPLYITTTHDRAIHIADLRGKPPTWMLKDTDSQTRTWQIGCGAGHVVLLPDENPYCPCGQDTCPEHEGYDNSDEYRDFRGSDWIRLRHLIERVSHG